MSFSDETIEAALAHLQAADPVMRDVVKRIGPFTLKLERSRFRMLVRSIISQQISTKAARAIRTRLEKRVAPRRVTAQNLLELPFEELRSVGLSPQKAGYVVNLSEKVLDGTVRLNRVGSMTDDEVIEELIQVKGIGRWTAQMFLMFCLGRLDVFPHDDLGIRMALRNLYGLDDLPDKQTSHEIAASWSPYATVASWYCWRSGDTPN